LQKSQAVSLIHENDETQISVYNGSLDKEVIIENLGRIKASFPSLPPEFFKIFGERIKDKGFSNQRLIDSVNNVIDNCQYPTPTLANFLSFDKRAKIYNYQKMCNVVSSNHLKPDYFSKIRINGKLFWVKTSDKDLYQLPDEF
jgi:hypothetical protein